MRVARHSFFLPMWRVSRSRAAHRKANATWLIFEQFFLLSHRVLQQVIAALCFVECFKVLCCSVVFSVVLLSWYALSLQCSNSNLPLVCFLLVIEWIQDFLWLWRWSISITNNVSIATSSKPTFEKVFILNLLTTTIHKQTWGLTAFSNSQSVATPLRFLHQQEKTQLLPPEKTLVWP